VVESAAETLRAIPALTERPSLERQVAASLRELIVTGRLPQGTPLRHRDLADRLGVSPTPVRAVLGQLEREGLVEIGRTGRALVSRLTREDLEEVYAARLGLEGLAARLGARAVGDAEVAAMRELLARLRGLAEAATVDDYLAARWQLHAVPYGATGRHRLVAEVERLFWRAERYNRLVLASKARFRRSLAYYRDFVNACAARDGEAAEAVIHASIRWAVDLLWERLPSERTLPPATRAG
jgi:DNA-binding GntR family transcriptional regulator